MGKGLTVVLFVILYALVTFFGLGPVLLADGSNSERMMTLCIILMIYILITALLIRVIKRWRRRS